MKHEILQTAPPVLRDFLTYCETIKGKSSLTAEEYYLDLQTFFRYLLMVRKMVAPDCPFEQIDISVVDIDLLRTVTLSDIYAFIVYCKNERQNGAAARARKCSTLRVYFRYLTLNVLLLETNPTEMLDAPKVKQALPRHLSLEDSLELLSTVDGPNYERDYCILTFFLNCGLRLSELCGLNITDISDDGSMRVTGKGNKMRLLYLNDACKDALKRYLAVRPKENIMDTDKYALFISRNRKRISNKTVQFLVKKYLEKAGLGNRGLSTHKLRHTAATLMYQHGNVDVRILKEILGHSNLGTTQIYTHVSDEQERKAMESNPLSRVHPKKSEKKSEQE